MPKYKPTDLRYCANAYMETYEHLLQPNTLTSYRRAYDLLDENGFQLDTVEDVKYIVSTMLELGFSNSTIRQYFKVFKVFYSHVHPESDFRWATRLLPRKTIQRKTMKLTRDEIDFFLKFKSSHSSFMSRRAEDNVRDLFVVSLYTGMALKEILNLRSEMIDPESETISYYRDKTGIESAIPVHKDVRTTLRRAPYYPVEINQANLVLKRIAKQYEGFHRKYMQTYTKGNDVVRESKKRHEYISFYCARHTACSRWIDEGVPLPKVARWMGHSSLHTTLKYYTDVMI